MASSLAEQDPVLAASCDLSSMNIVRRCGKVSSSRAHFHCHSRPGSLARASARTRCCRKSGRAAWAACGWRERSDGRFEGQVAVKFLNLALIGSGGEERFKREGTILARLAHPHIAQLVDAGVSTAGQPYLVLEYVEGDRIDRYCDAQASTWKRACASFSTCSSRSRMRTPT